MKKQIYLEEEEEENEEVVVEDSSTKNYPGGVIVFFKPITPETIQPLCEYIIRTNILETDIEFITLILCTPGGDLSATLALTDIMIGSRIPIHTVGLGVVASGGLLVLMSGKKGKRIVTPNTILLSHQWSGGSYGKQHELVAERKCQEQMSKIFLDFYKNHSKIKSTKKIQEKLLNASDVWLTPAEAIEFGLCDEIKKFDNSMLSN